MKRETFNIDAATLNIVIDTLDITNLGFVIREVFDSIIEGTTEAPDVIRREPGTHLAFCVLRKVSWISADENEVE